jgi:hypothetical protein
MNGFTCGRCDSPIPPDQYNSIDFLPCPACGTPVKIDVFPVVLNDRPSVKNKESVVADEASCFYHAANRAEFTCDQCGRFLCPLCRIELGDRHLCPVCLETGRKKGKLVNLDQSRTLYDSLALRIAIFPVFPFAFLWIFTCITAPVALFLALRHWNSPMSIVRRSKIRLVAAIVASGLQISTWLFGIAYMAILR